MNMPEGFTRGEAGFQKVEQFAAERAAKKAEGYGPRRFYQKVGESATLIILDRDPADEQDDSAGPMFIWEHALWKPGSKFPEFYSCYRGWGECPLCDSGDSSYYIGAYTVINMTGYTTKEGKNSGPVKQVLPLKQTVLNRLNAKRKDFPQPGMHCAVLKFGRFEKKEAVTGSDITYLKHTNMENLIKTLQAAEKEKGYKILPEGQTWEQFLQPVDYFEYFKYKTVDELRVIAGQAPPVGSDAHAEGRTMPPPFAGGAVSDQSIDSLL